MSIYNSKKDILSPFSTCHNFYAEKSKINPNNNFDVQTVKKNPSEKLALKCQKIELEDNIEKQRLYESKLNSLNQKIERNNESKKRSTNLFNKRQLNTLNQVNSLKRELEINEKLNLEKEKNILSLKESIIKQENFLQCISKINNSQKENLLRKNIDKRKILIREISETNFEKKNNLIRFKEESENLNSDLKNINFQIKTENDYKDEILENKNIIKTSLQGQTDINKMNNKQLEEIKKTYEEKNTEKCQIKMKIRFYKEKLFQKINELKNIQNTMSINKELHKKILLNLKKNKENEKILKENLENIKLNVNEKDKDILDLKQTLMEKKFKEKQNNEEISYSKNFLDSLKNVVEKNIETYSKFIKINRDIKVFSQDFHTSDLKINRVKNDIDNIKKLI